MFIRSLASRRFIKLLIAVTVAVMAGAHHATAQTTQFTYQGKLNDGGAPANSAYDFQFKLFDAATVGTGTQHGTTQTVANVTVSAGIFSVQLNFGACATCFNGGDRFLEIAVKVPSSATFTTLAPRQPISSTPYAIKSQNATSADGLSVACVNCITGSQIASVNGSAVTGTIPVASVPAGSGNYIQNTNAQQVTSNFNISGNGTAGGTLAGQIVNATTQYNLGGARILVGGINNLFAGLRAGLSNTTGFNNSFFGATAGESNTEGFTNSFFGRAAGQNNTTGFANSFFGRSAGESNTTGSENTLIGYGADVGANNLTNATAIGFEARVTQSNSLVLGGGSTNVGIGTSAPLSQLHVRGDSPVRILGDTITLGGTEYVDFMARNSQYGTDTGGMRIQRQTPSGDIDVLFLAARSANPVAEVMRVKGNGSVGIGTPNPAATLHVNGNIVLIPSGAGGDSACLLTILGGREIVPCASSLRYKKDLAPYTGGLDLLKRLRPISFTWKDRPQRDLGLAAEEVAAVEPLLVTHNDKGEIEGVKYDRLSAVFINAFKEQQTQIQQEQQQIEQQQKQIATLLTSNAALNARLRGVEKSLRKNAGSARRRR
jgi:hypothetical protein